MTNRFVAGCLSLMLAFAASAQPLFAQSDSGSITIVVDDETGKNPIELARVLLDGPVIASELTDKRGEVRFTDVPDGIYRARIAHGGYQPITSTSFEVVNGRAVTVSVTLALSTSLKVIGTVSARSTATISATSIDANSAQRKLSSDLADALNKLSGVSVTTSSDDSDATQTISLEGHDASQTQLSLNGIPLNAPGVAGNLRGFATDLFGGASVRNGPQLGGLGGGVNFATLQPTLSWMSQLQLGDGSNGKYNYSLAESGSFDKLGIAVQSVYRLNPSLVDGMTYLDASGLDYNHYGDSSISGNLVTGRYEFGDTQALSATFLNSVRQTNIVCLRITQTVPCGYGPNNTSSGNVQLYSVTDDALIGGTSVQASMFSSSGVNVNDELNRYLDGVAAPTGFSSLNRSRGYTLNATLPAKERHTISLTAYGVWGDSETTPLVTQAQPYYTGTSYSNYSAFQINDSIRSSDKLTLGETVGFSRATNSNSSALGSTSLTWRPTQHDTYTASYAIGGVSASPTRSQILTDPASMRFDCTGEGYAYGNAPGDQPGPSSSISERVGYTRSFKGGSLTFQVYNQLQDGVVMPVQVNGTVLAPGLFPTGYLNAVNAVYQSQAGCNSPTPLTLSQLYFSTPIGGVQRVYQGGSITGFATFGNLVVQPFWNVTVSKAISNNVSIDNPYSITVSGRQLPNVPLQRGGIVLDYKSPHSMLEWLADAQYTGANNQNNLPAFTQFDAGVSAQLGRGTLTFAASNITNAYSGIFASPQNAVPYYAQNGAEIPTIARPLAPRNYALTYGIKFGPGALGDTHVAALVIGGGRGGGPGGGGFRQALTPLPSSPPSNPLDVQANAQLCAADATASAQKLSSELKNYVVQIETAKNAVGYPATMAPPQLDDATVTYHGLGSTYALSIVPKFANAQTERLASSVLASPSPAPGASGPRGRGGPFRMFFGCLALHAVQPADVAARHLYAPSGSLFTAPQITFMPSVGLYVQLRAPQAGAESFRVYALPNKAPMDPFELRSTAATCTPELHTTASEALGELKAYFSNGTAAALWTITAHAAKSGTWYSLTPGDPSILGSLLMCGRIAATAPKDIVERGWDGMMPPDVNYAPAFGLYVIRQLPNPPVRTTAP